MLIFVQFLEFFHAQTNTWLWVCSLCIFKKGSKECKCTCLDCGLHKWKLITPVNTHFASKVSMFQQCLIYWQAIARCYSHRSEALANKIPSTMTWVIAKAICEVLFLVVTCVVNQHHGYWLLCNALVNTIRLYVRLKKERSNMQTKVNLATSLDMQMKVKQLG